MNFGAFLKKYNVWITMSAIFGISNLLSPFQGWE
jgi:hypothetical protein